MALNIDKMSKRNAEVQRRSAERKNANRRSIMRRLKPGTTWIYLCPPIPAMDNEVCVRADQHFGINPGYNAPVFSLAEDNDGIWNPQTLKLLKEFNEKRKEKNKPTTNLDVRKGCPIADLLEGTDPSTLGIATEIDEKRAQGMRRKETYWFPYVPIKFSELKADGTDGPIVDLPVKEQVPFLLPAPPTLYSGIVSKVVQIVSEQRHDLTDPLAAVLIKVKFYEKNIWTYEVDIDIASLLNHVKLPKTIRFAIKQSCIDGGEADPFRFFAAMVKDREQILDLVRGSATRTTTHDDDDDDQPPCFGVPGEINPDDEECQSCSYKVACAAVTGSVVPPDVGGKTKKDKAAKLPPPPVEEDEEDEEEPAPPPVKKDKAAKLPPPPVVEDEEEDDDEEEEEPTPPPAKKGKGAKLFFIPVEDEEDEEEEEPTPLPVPTKKGKAAKLPPPPVEDDEEDEEEDDIPDFTKSAARGLEDEDEDEPTSVSTKVIVPDPADSSANEFAAMLAKRRAERSKRGK